MKNGYTIQRFIQRGEQTIDLNELEEQFQGPPQEDPCTDQYLRLLYESLCTQEYLQRGWLNTFPFHVLFSGVQQSLLPFSVDPRVQQNLNHFIQNGEGTLYQRELAKWLSRLGIQCGQLWKLYAQTTDKKDPQLPIAYVFSQGRDWTHQGPILYSEFDWVSKTQLASFLAGFREYLTTHHPQVRLDEWKEDLKQYELFLEQMHQLRQQVHVLINNVRGPRQNDSLAMRPNGIKRSQTGTMSRDEPLLQFKRFAPPIKKWGRDVCSFNSDWVAPTGIYSNMYMNEMRRDGIPIVCGISGSTWLIVSLWLIAYIRVTSPNEFRDPLIGYYESHPATTDAYRMSREQVLNPELFLFYVFGTFVMLNADGGHSLNEVLATIRIAYVYFKFELIQFTSMDTDYIQFTKNQLRTFAETHLEPIVSRCNPLGFKGYLSPDGTTFHINGGGTLPHDELLKQVQQYIQNPAGSPYNVYDMIVRMALPGIDYDKPDGSPIIEVGDFRPFYKYMEQVSDRYQVGQTMSQVSTDVVTALDDYIEKSC
jgi:hypothetical protein